MKAKKLSALFRRVFLAPSGAAIVAALIATPANCATIVFEDDFSTGTLTKWTTADQTTVSTTGDPFGTGSAGVNIYANLNDTRTDINAKLITGSVFGSGGLYTANVRFFEPTATNRNEPVTLGFSTSTTSIGSADRINAINLSNGVIGGLEVGSGSYSLDTGYEVALFLNRTTTNQVDYVSGRTLAALSMDVWLRPLSGGSYTFLGTSNNDRAVDPTTFGLHSFNADRQQIFVDNVTLYDGLETSIIPEPSSLLLGAIGALALLRRKR